MLLRWRGKTGCGDGPLLGVKIPAGGRVDGLCGRKSGGVFMLVFKLGRLKEPTPLGPYLGLGSVGCGAGWG